MVNTSTPEAIHVDFPLPGENGSTHSVHMQTSLFRAGSFVTEAWQFATERAADPANFQIRSAGCSIGTEIDSGLAWHRRQGYEASVTAIGYDLNRLALQGARRARYLVCEQIDPKLDQDYEGIWEPEKSAIEEWGFRPVFGIYTDEEGVTQARLEADATPLREGHDVSFVLHDLMDPMPEAAPADLILANNILYHFPYEDALWVVNNLARTLAERGVINLGRTFLTARHLKKPVSKLLKREFDLEEIFSDPADSRFSHTPIMFARA